MFEVYCNSLKMGVLFFMECVLFWSGIGNTPKTPSKDTPIMRMYLIANICKITPKCIEITVFCSVKKVFSGWDLGIGIFARKAMLKILLSTFILQLSVYLCYE